MKHSAYIGRFAPTPTGPLHMGSLVAALASYLDAKAHQGQWLLRIEDLDPPREDPNAKTLIPQQLIAHGLHWDGDLTFQSEHSARYEHALEQLRQQQRLFACTCSRKQLAGQLHQGNCHSTLHGETAWRLLVDDQTWMFVDRVYGEQSQNLQHQVGDPVLKRKDGLYAYQLAVVVDDEASGVTHVVRGADLLDNTQRQLYLQACLGYTHPEYLHLPLVINEQGQKLSKQNQAKALDLTQVEANLFQCLGFLHQQPPAHLAQSSCSEQLRWAIEHWQPEHIQPSLLGL